MQAITITPLVDHEPGQYSTVNEQLRAAREQRFWSMEKAAQKVGVSAYTYYRWETGKQRPHLSSLGLLCKTFGLSPAQLGFTHLSNQMDHARTDDPHGSSVSVHHIVLHIVSIQVHERYNEDDLEQEYEDAEVVNWIIDGKVAPCGWHDLSVEERHSLSQALLPLWKSFTAEKSSVVGSFEEL